MNKFNLTFRGEILPDMDPAQVQTRLGELLGIDDPAALAECFSGETVILRRDLDRKSAADYYAKLTKLGARAELITISDLGAGGSATTPTAASPETGAAVTPPPGQAREQPQPPPRQADLATEKHLPNQDVALLKSKEAALKKALQAKQKEQQQDKLAKKASEKAAAEEAEREARETARLEAELAERRRQVAAEAAQRKAAEAARLEAELTERKRKAEQERRQAEEAARLEAELAERKRKAAAEAAQRKAEEAARRKAELAQRKRRAAAEAAQRKAEKSARRKAELAERKRKAAAEAAQREAEEAARLEAELAEKIRLKAEQTARLEAEQAEQRAEQQRIKAVKAAEKAALQAQEKRKVEQLAAMVKAENTGKKRMQAQDASLRKAREQRQRAEEQARLKRIQIDQLAQRRALEEQAIQRAATELTQSPALKPVKTKVRSRLELPQRKSSKGDTSQDRRRRRRQPGEPNLYSLRPFRNTPDIQARAEQSRHHMKAGFITAGLAFTILLALTARLLSLPPTEHLAGASAMAVGSQGQLVLLAGDRLLLHDRSGAGSGDLPIADLGLITLAPPLVFGNEGELFATGQLAGQPLAAPQLLRCTLSTPGCQVFSAELADSGISGLAVHPLDGSVFLADTGAGELLKLSAEGTILARAAANVPAQPRLALDSGLLLMNSAVAPAVSVFRYEDSAFGAQLDEILLLPPEAVSSQHSRVGDFVGSEAGWWVTLYNPDAGPGGGNAGLYRFDTSWKFLGRAGLTKATRVEQVAAWGRKILVRDSHQVPLQRFSAQGQAEVPLVSKLLQAMITDQESRANLRAVSWRVGLALLGLIAVAGWGAGFLYRVRGMVYTTCKASGAQPVDELADSIDWVDLAADRATRLHRTSISYTVLALALVLMAMGLGVPVIQLSSLLLALTGLAVALALVYRGEPGHIGIVNGQLLLVDHTGMYHLGGGSRIHYRGRFLMIDDVTVFTGTRQLPVFAAAQLLDKVMPLAWEGVRVDRRIVMVKLLQGRHPLALAATTLLAFTAAAITVISLQGVY